MLNSKYRGQRWDNAHQFLNGDIFIAITDTFIDLIWIYFCKVSYLYVILIIYNKNNNKNQILLYVTR